VRLSEWDGMLDLWMRILDIMDRLMNSGQDLDEAVPESLKNVLLVMSSSGYLTPPEDENGEGDRLWQETWTRLDRFLPSLKEEIFPAPPPRPPPLSPPVHEHQQEQEEAPSSEEALATTTTTNGDEA